MGTVTVVVISPEVMVRTGWFINPNRVGWIPLHMGYGYDRG